MGSRAIFIAAIFLCLCNLTAVHAEEPDASGAVVRVGGLLGGGLVDWVGKDANVSLPEFESVAKPGFAAGLFASLDAGRLLALDIKPFHLALQPEFGYATRGAGIERDGDDRGSYNLSYLQTRLLLRVGYATSRTTTPYLILGPELSFLRRGEIENSTGDTTNIEDDLKSTDFGLILGLGALYELPPYGSLGLELRGDLGLVSIDGQGDGDEIRNAALSLLLVYLY
jgi:opacity protein-like surface antigen